MGEVKLSAYRHLIVSVVAGAFVLFSVGKSCAQPGLEDARQMKKLLDKATEEYRKFFQKPKTPAEHWAALEFEVEIGKFDLAALFLKQLLELQPKENVDKALLLIEEVKGLQAFTRLRAVKKWTDYKRFDEAAKKNVEILITRMTKALQDHLTSATRIKKFIGNLDAKTIEERAYAYLQLQRSGPFAVSYMLDAMLANKKTALHDKIVEAMVSLPKDIVPAFLEVFKARNAKDAGDSDLRLTMLDIVHKRADRRVVPYLWHMSESKLYSAAVRLKAKQLLALFEKTPLADLPPANKVLTEMAEQYFEHNVRFSNPNYYKYWNWDGAKLGVMPTVLTVRQAETLFGLRHAREALELEPNNQRTQIVFLNQYLRLEIFPALDQSAYNATPDSLQRLLVKLDTNFLLTMLDQATRRNAVPILLPIIDALGKQGSARAARVSGSGRPIGLAKTLDFPNRRVQFAAAEAVLNLPLIENPFITADKNPIAATRVIEVLRRFLNADLEPKAMVLFPPMAEAAKIRGWVRAGGWQTDVAYKINDAIKQLHASTDYDVIFIHQNATKMQIAFAMTQLRQDRNHGNLPVLLVTPKKRADELERIAAKHRFTWTLPEAYFRNAQPATEVFKLRERSSGTLHVTEEEFKAFEKDSGRKPTELTAFVLQRMREAGGLRLTLKERAQMQMRTLDYLKKMAVGQMPGYNVRSAMDELLNLLPSADDGTTLTVIEILGRLKGAKAQQQLGKIVLDYSENVLDPKLKKEQLGNLKKLKPALAELNQHVQKHNLFLTNEQMLELRIAAEKMDADPADKALKAALTPVRNEFAVLTGRLTAGQTSPGVQLFKFRP